MSTTVGDLIDEGLANLRTGPFGTQLKASDYGEEGVPVLNVRNLGFGSLRPADIEYAPQQVQERLNGHLLRAGDILFGRKGAVDRHVLISEKQDGWMQGSDCIRLRLESGTPVLAKYLSKLLLTDSHKMWIEAQCSHGATMASLNQDIIRRIALDLPPLRQQRRVVAVLTSFDELIEINERRIDLLEELARSLYREWFVHFRFPRHQNAEFVDLDHGRLPAGWRNRKLGDIAELNGKKIKASDIPDPFQYLDISSVGVGTLEVPVFISALKAPSRARRRASDGDVVWATVRPNRRSHALIHDPPPELVVSTGLAVLTPVGAPSSFLFEYAASDEFSGHLIGRASGAAYPAVRPDDFKSAPVLLPPQSLLERFDGLVDPMLRSASFLRRRNWQFAATRDLLLPRLVTGQLDISDIDLGVLSPAEAG